MRLVLRFGLFTFASMLSAAPVSAASSVALPEPGTLTLLTLGIIGVVIGRHASRKPPED